MASNTRSSGDEPTNMQRALWAKAALTIFTAETYGGDEPDTMDRSDLEDAIADLICDLLHFVQLHPRMDAAEIHARALKLFNQETADEEFCDCADRSWYGAYHDTQCPVRPGSPPPLSASENSQPVAQPNGSMAAFQISIGIYRTVVTVDNRFKIEIRRTAPPPLASAQLVIKVYPMTDGEAWDEAYETFAVDEGRIVELETQMKE